MLQHTRSIIACLLVVCYIATGCKKEKALAPSNLDENFLVVKDNPSDPVDHQLYLFYKETGIPGFYNDTVVKKEVGVSNGVPQYAYQFLSLLYQPIGSYESKRVLVSNKQVIPPLLAWMRTDVLPHVPKSAFIPSILFLDSFDIINERLGPSSPDGWDAYYGYNTLAVICRDLDTMSMEARKNYATSIITGIAARSMQQQQAVALQKNFYSISRDLVMQQWQTDVYAYFLMEFLFTTIPAPETMGFFHYCPYVIRDGSFLLILTLAPPEEDDLRMYLWAALSYTEQNFINRYPGQPLLLQKFKAMQQLATSIGLPLP